MDIRLLQSDFVDDRFSIAYSANKRATFINVQESFQGNNDLGVVDRINIMVEAFDTDGVKTGGSFSTSIIGVGDSLVGVLSDDVNILGTTLTWDNMEQCVIRLYEQ